MVDGAILTVAASAARTTTGNSAAQRVPHGSLNVVLELDVTAVSGTTPNLAPTVQWSTDGGTTFADADPVDAFTAITAVSNKAKTFTVKGEHFRLVWTITGTTPSFTFKAAAYGV